MPRGIEGLVPLAWSLDSFNETGQYSIIEHELIMCYSLQPTAYRDNRSCSTGAAVARRKVRHISSLELVI
jgi:hypothetical protein